MAALFQRASDGRWVARVRTLDGVRYVTGTDRDDVARRAAAIPEVGVRHRPVGDDRFWSKVLIGPNCWLWRGHVKSLGYGQYRVGDKLRQAHRVAYELVVGPIPDGLTIDHLCSNPWCVNPAHMEPVTAAENLRRRSASGPGPRPLA